MSPVAPEGVQLERANLAWRRTALSLAVGAIVSLRVLPPALGDAIWFAPGVVGVLFAAWMWRIVRRRSQVFGARLRGDHPAPGAGALFTAALFTMLIGVVAAVAVLTKGW